MAVGIFRGGVSSGFSRTGGAGYFREDLASARGASIDVGGEWRRFYVSPVRSRAVSGRYDPRFQSGDSPDGELSTRAETRISRG